MRLSILLACLMTPTLLMAKPESGTLRDAFKKEFAFLESEQAVLEKRLQKAKRALRQEAGRSKVVLAGLQRQIVQQTTESDAMADAMVDLERQVDALGESEEALTGLGDQISRGLESEGVVWKPKMGAVDGESAEDRLKREAGQILTGFDLSFKSLEQGGQVRREPGEFFLSDGKQVNGTLLKVGKVAVYGVAGGQAGALTPAGNGHFKLDPPQGADTARALIEGRQEAQIKLFLFENTTKNFEPPKEKTVLEIINSGGVIAWVIVGLGILAMLLLVIRALLLVFAGTNTERLWDRIEDVVYRGDLMEASKFCETKRGAGARILAALTPVLKEDRDDLERVFSERMVVEEGYLDRFGSIILVIAAVAPLLGLLGTVTGMISTFDVITEFGTGNPKLLSGGISEALVTTELGLCVAIPTLLFGNILNGWATKMKGNLEFGALRLINAVRCRKRASQSAETNANWDGALTATGKPA
ncbi:MAG: MotA/TolQ/ExbB proton channel family protein [Myxococcota bacterium]|nr:MotA/TolQ/ExbB proton channel family protein [Myxococcota bacterium]